MPPGFLAVLTHPSSSLSLTDFHAWYEEEHIPLRLNHLPSFLSGARYEAVDLPDTSLTPTTPPAANNPEREGGKDKEQEEEPLPTWLALYEIDDTSTFSAPSYTGLRTNRSAREADVMRRLDVLVRWAGEEVGVWYPPSSLHLRSSQPEGGEEEEGHKREERRTTGLKPGRPSRCVVTHTLSLLGPLEEADAMVKKWAARVVRAASSNQNPGRVKGFVSTRVVRVIEGGKARLGVPVPFGGDKEERVEYLVVHELESDSLPTAFPSDTNQDASDADTDALRNIISSLSSISSLDIGTADQSPSSVGPSSDGPREEEKGREEEEGNEEEEEGNKEEEGNWKMKVDIDIDDWRVWKLHKAYPCIAQGNLGVGLEAGVDVEGEQVGGGGEAGVGGVDFLGFGE